MKNKRIVLIHPFAKTPPFGILSIASFLKKHGKDVRIIDYYIHNDVPKKQILDDIRGADIIGISVLTGPMLKYACRITRIIRRNFNGFLVWGGIHATLFPEKSIKDMNLDGVILNEGEVTFLELVDALERETSLEKVNGLVIKKGKEIIFTGKREPIYDMSILPRYDWSMIDPKKYTTRNLITGRTSILLIESRGCPFNCAYCYVNKMFGKWRGREPDEIISEMKYLNKEYDITHFDLLDDLPFGGRKDKMLEFCNKLAPLNFSWISAYRVNFVDREIINAMKKANCKHIFFGVESGSPRILEMINRNMTLDMVKRAFKLCNEIGIGTTAGFIVGFPTETEEDLDLTLKLMKEIKPTIINYGKFVPYPGGKLYEKSIEMGFKLPKKTEDFADFGNYDSNEGINLSLIPEGKIRKAKNFARWLSIKNTLLFSFKHKNYNYTPYFILDSLPPKISGFLINVLSTITKPLRKKSLIKVKNENRNN